jgi:putative colanic acid biosynthesis acetyltransferase WcaF
MDDHACLGRQVDCYNVALVYLGPRALISQGAYLCTASHDYRDQDFPLTCAPITVEAGAWVAAQSFIGPGVTVGEGAVLGARGVATKNLKPWTVCAGNPAVFIKDRVRPET